MSNAANTKQLVLTTRTAKTQKKQSALYGRVARVRRLSSWTVSLSLLGPMFEAGAVLVWTEAFGPNHKEQGNAHFSNSPQISQNASLRIKFVLRRLFSLFACQSLPPLKGGLKSRFPALPRTSPHKLPAQAPRTSPHFPAQAPRTSSPHFPALPRTSPHFPAFPRTSPQFPAVPRSSPQYA